MHKDDKYLNFETKSKDVWTVSSNRTISEGDFTMEKLRKTSKRALWPNFRSKNGHIFTRFKLIRPSTFLSWRFTGAQIKHFKPNEDHSRAKLYPKSPEFRTPIVIHSQQQSSFSLLTSSLQPFIVSTSVSSTSNSKCFIICDSHLSPGVWGRRVLKKHLV